MNKNILVFPVFISLFSGFAFASPAFKSNFEGRQKSHGKIFLDKFPARRVFRDVLRHLGKNNLLSDEEKMVLDPNGDCLLLTIEYFNSKEGRKDQLRKSFLSCYETGCRFKRRHGFVSKKRRYGPIQRKCDEFEQSLNDVEQLELLRSEEKAINLLRMRALNSTFLKTLEILNEEGIYISRKIAGLDREENDFDGDLLFYEYENRFSSLDPDELLD